MDIANRIKLINIAKSHLDMVHGELEAARQMYEKMDRLLENAVEIGQIAALLEEKEKIEVEDGKELAMFCVDLAKEFEEKFDPENGDYWLDIDEFASDALIEEFGAEKEPEPSFIKSDEAYRTYMHTPCYVIDKKGAWSHSQLLALVHGDDFLCGVMFTDLNGQTPQSYITERLKNHFWAKCESCNRYFDASNKEMVECPLCYAKLPGDVHYDVAVDKELCYS